MTTAMKSSFLNMLQKFYKNITKIQQILLTFLKKCNILRQVLTLEKNL